MDIRFADAILIMGSNMAECHPVSFRFVMQAKLAGGKIIHVDPRFTRTSAMADVYAPLRPGTDIVFLGGLIRFILEEKRYFREYVTAYTNAATLITEEYRDTEDLAGLFSGFDSERHEYDPRTWRYEAEPRERPGNQPVPDLSDASTFSARAGKLTKLPHTDPTLEHPRCVLQILRRHYARYTPELVEQVCGTPRATFLKVAEALCNASGPDRTAALCYAVGWTQHTTGVQIIRAATILQSLLGNIGRPGGGILALRGHASIQGSTDIPTLYNLLPGYLNAPSALKSHDSLADYITTEISPTSYWVHFPKFIVSLLKAWFGEAATKANDFGYDWLPKTTGDHSHMPMFVAMNEGKLRGFFAMGQNPAVGGQNAGFQRRALARLDWMVVRDLYETETASFWKDAPEIRSGDLRSEDIATEVFLLPAAATAEMDGSYTNTQRLIQWHDRAADPPGDARSDLWFTVQLGLRLKKLYAGSTLERDRPIHALTWDYIDAEENHGWKVVDEPSATRVLREMNGYDVATGRPVSGFGALKADGSTACGAWIYSGIYAPTREQPNGHNHAANRQGDDWVALGWAFAWPANRRVMYNRASADPQGNPWPKESRLARRFAPRGEKGYVYWDPDAIGPHPDDPSRQVRGRWVGVDVPDFPLLKSPGTPARPDGIGLDFHDGASPFIMKGDGKAWLFAPSGLVDGPLPTHYEPYESPVANLVYPDRASNPVVKLFHVPGNAYAAVGSAEYPCILSTYRLTEHHLSGSMSRWLPWLATLQPELFVEISPEHAQELGAANLDMVRIRTPRAQIQAKALVTRRIRPFSIEGRTLHQVGMPWHWGYKGISTGDVVNDLSALVGDPNVSIHEAKVFVCRVERVGPLAAT
ncbi:MAG: molybdopterin-dependent oxidoreductase [Isosphaeraceae bacterium]